MDISKKAKMNIFLMWLLIVPIGICIVYLTSPTKPSDWDHYIYFLILALLTTIFPFFIAGSLMVLVQWVNLAIFLKFGILAELISMQLCILPILFHMKLTKETRYKLYYNSFMFFCISIICGSLVLWIGYEIGTLVINEILLYGSIYMLLNIVLNHLFLYLREVFTGLKPKFFTKDFSWDFICLIITLPFGISIYILEGRVGPIAFILLGVPFLAITLLIRMYNDSEKVNTDLNKASEFGHQLAERMTTTEVLDMFLRRMSDMFPFDTGYIVDNVDSEFFILRAIEDGENKELEYVHEDIKYSLAGKGYEKGEPILYNKQAEWTHMKPPFLADDMQSVMCVPIYRNQRIEGVLVLAARAKFAFESYQLKIVHLLCFVFCCFIRKSQICKRSSGEK